MAVVLDVVDFRARDFCYIESRRRRKLAPVIIRRLKWDGVQVTGRDGETFYFDFGSMGIGWRAWDQMPGEQEMRAQPWKQQEEET